MNHLNRSQIKAIKSKHTIRFIRQGVIPKQSNHEYAFVYEDEPNMTVFTKSKKLRHITPKKIVLIFGHEKMHSVLQKRVGKTTSRKYDNIATGFNAERFMQQL